MDVLLDVAATTPLRAFTVQNALPGLGYADGNQGGWLADYALTLTHAATSIRAIIERTRVEALLADRPSLAVAVGHDSGDGLLLGVLRETGFDDSEFGWI